MVQYEFQKKSKLSNATIKLQINLIITNQTKYQRNIPRWAPFRTRS